MYLADISCDEIAPIGTSLFEENSSRLEWEMLLFSKIDKLRSPLKDFKNRNYVAMPCFDFEKIVNFLSGAGIHGDDLSLSTYHAKRAVCAGGANHLPEMRAGCRPKAYRQPLCPLTPPPNQPKGAHFRGTPCVRPRQRAEHCRRAPGGLPPV